VMDRSALQNARKWAPAMLRELEQLGLIKKIGDGHLLSEKAITTILKHAYYVADHPRIQSLFQALQAGCVYAYINAKGHVKQEEVVRATSILLILLAHELGQREPKTTS